MIFILFPAYLICQFHFLDLNQILYYLLLISNILRNLFHKVIPKKLGGRKVIVGVFIDRVNLHGIAIKPSQKIAAVGYITSNLV